MRWVLMWVLGLWGVLSLLAAPAWADQLIMKDGTVIKGTVMKSGARYWVDKEGGGTQFVAVEDVKEWVKDNAGATTAAPPGPAAPAVKGTTAKFGAVKGQVERVILATAAVGLWEEFLKTNPSDADTTAAKTELAKWQPLAADGAELINGKWVGGAEHKKILDEAAELYRAAQEDAENDREIAAMQKLEKAVKVYPNMYEANSVLGFYAMMSHKEEDAQKYFTTCIRLRPEAIDAMNNMAIALLARNRWEEGVKLLQKAIEKQDSVTVTGNLQKALHSLPKDLANAVWAKAAQGPADLLAAKYGLTRIPDWRLVRYRYLPPLPQTLEGMSGMISGTGFVVGGDGTILTNRHVVHKTTALWVVLAGKRVPAEIVKEDVDLDLALVRLKPAASATQPALPKLTQVELAKTDLAADGAQCYVVGFPLASRLGISLKVTQGIISGSAKAPEGVDLLIDAKVNPGNSGGPLLDKSGQVIGIVSMKSETTSYEDSYGMAISVGKLRRFLDANKVAFKTGAEGAALAPEDIVARVKGGTVCILGQVK